MTSQSSPDRNFTESQQALIAEQIGKVEFLANGHDRTTQISEWHASRILTGGRSGALVAEISVNDRDRRHLCVLKVDSTANLVNEWVAYKKLIAPVDSKICAAVVGATTNLIRGPGHRTSESRSAIMYEYVTKNAVGSSTQTTVMEDLVKEALYNSELLTRTTKALDDLLSEARRVLYSRYTVVKRSTTLRWFNIWLAPNITLRINKIGSFTSRSSRLSSPQEPDRLYNEDEIIRKTSTGVPGLDFQTGQAIAFRSLRYHEMRDAPVAIDGDVLIDISRHSRVPIDTAVAALTSKPVAVDGIVEWTRGTVQRRRMHESFQHVGEIFEGDSHLAYGALKTADPFEAIPHVLTASRRGRIISVVHGDLNPRNILVADTGKPYLIDYAKVRDKRPQQSDFCWLEINLMRNVFAGFELTEQAALQRLLSLAAYSLRSEDRSTDDKDQEVLHVFADLIARSHERLFTAFQVLFMIRRHAWNSFPIERAGFTGNPHQVWLTEYLEQLLIAAHRTVKWNDENQTDMKLRVSFLTASIASEWLSNSNPFLHWDDASLAEGAALVASGKVLSEESHRDLAAKLVAMSESRLAMVYDFNAMGRKRELPRLCRVKRA